MSIIWQNEVINISPMEQGMKKYIGLVLLGILTAATLTSYYLLRRGLPQTEGELMLKNLSKPVEVIRDSFGIPHIFAQSEVDAARTLGYVMASERLFQMDLMRRIGSGRLSEIIGKKTLEIDILMRKLQIRKAAVEYYKKNRQNPELENYAAAFYEGVQQYIDNNSLPIEFVILGYKPEPFTIVDAMAVTGYMGLSFAEGMVGDVLFSKLASVLSKEMLNELRVGPTNYFERKGYSKSTAPYQDTELFSSILNTQEFLVDTFTMFHGSNSWVLAGSRTKSGKPILANDPHIAYSNPSVWFEAHIHTPNFELYGHYLPLIPFAGIGHNKEKAWAITMSEIDDFNLYIEKVNPKNKNQVMYKGKWKNLETYQEVIKVKGQDPVTVDVKVSEHGPLIDGTKFESKDHSISVKWTYHDSDNHAVETFYLLNRAKTLEEYKYAVSRASSPGLNISWVDQTGNIAWWTMGKTPEIKLGMATDVLLNGWDGNHEYDSYIGFENRPHSVNPDG
ncbi:MAG: penicillin amidase, partial [Thermoproteota archaeon]